MNKSILVLGFFLIGILIMFLVSRFTIKNVENAKQLNASPSTRKIIFGAWTEGFYDSQNQTLNPDKMLEFEKLIDRKVSIVHYYLGWEKLAKPEILKQFETIDSNGWQPMLNVNPYYFDECPASEVPLYRAIADGECDAFIRKAAKNMSQVKKPFYLVFAWEMNNWQNDWSISKTGSTNQDFVKAWRHIHNIFKEENATNVIWVFNPNVPEEEKFPYNMIYPGAEYVDWIGLDGYNWGTTQDWSEWINFEGIFKGPYESITGLAPDKPLILAEFNTTDKGGDKGEWYKDAFLTQIPNDFPKIQAVIIFNEDKSKNEKVNWKVDVNQESLKAFKESVNSEYYKKD